MIYKYDWNSLEFKKHVPKPWWIVWTLVVITAMIVAYNLGFKKGYESPKELSVSVEQADTFTSEKFKSYLKDLQISYPHIVYAQACLETGHFKSKIFLSNNNLFGMREARGRVSTNKGAENGHAVYLHWRESVLDYALFQCCYLKNIKSEAEYYEYLKKNYAEDTTYVSKLKIIAEEYK
jgi:hypothetical protein